MPNANTLTPENRFFGLFVGASGSGKTVAEASFPKPIEFWDFDGRIRGILGANWIDRSNGITYEAFPPNTENLIDKLQKKMETMLLMSSMGQPMPTTLVIDSVTTQNIALVNQAMKLTHSKASSTDKPRGKYLGSVPMAGPEDYGLESTFSASTMSFLRSIPIPNIIVSGHIINKWGKDPNAASEFAPNIVIGEQLALRDKIAESIPIYFDHCFRFYKRDDGSSERFCVKFRGEAPIKTSYAELPYGEVDITGKPFYETMQELIKQGVPKL